MKHARQQALFWGVALATIAETVKAQPDSFSSGNAPHGHIDGDRVSLSLEDADLPELVRVIGELTGKRFIVGAKLRSIKATVYSPEKVTVAEAYQAFLSVLQSNGLTLIPHGRFYKIVDAMDAKASAPVVAASQAATSEERYVTRLHRLRSANADEAATVLGHFKSKDGDITVYGPGNLLIITDTAPNIERMLSILADIDVEGAGAQVFIEPVHYASASDLAKRIDEVLDSRAVGKVGPEKGASGGPTSAGLQGPVTRMVADDRSNALIIIATPPAYLRVLELVKVLDVPPKAGEGEIHVLSLQHADAVELVKTLNEIVTSEGKGPGSGGPQGAGLPPLTFFESRVKASADKSTNSIIVTSSLRDLANLRTVVDQLDQPRRQVFIEAAILDLTVDHSDQWSTSFHMAGTDNGGGSGNSILYGGLNPFRTIALPSSTDSSLSALALGIRGPGVTGTENLLGTGVSIPAFGVLIDAMASSNDADILSTPHILATDNVPAEISIGQNIPLQTNAGGSSGLTGSSGTTGSLASLGLLGGGTTSPRQDIGTKLKIVPHLNDSNEVRLEITEEISDVTGQQPLGSLGAVPFSKRTAQTQLVAQDQQTVVIGGLVRSHVAQTVTKIPLLGDIPILGMLFRSTSSSQQKSNLMLVLTPYIIRERADLRTIFERKMQERQEFLDHYFVFSDEDRYEPPKDYSRTNGLLEEIRQSYLEVEERGREKQLRKSQETKTHAPVEPLGPAPTSQSASVSQ
jgi:general secretion pathway protein D